MDSPPPPPPPPPPNPHPNPHPQITKILHSANPLLRSGHDQSVKMMQFIYFWCYFHNALKSDEYILKSDDIYKSELN